MHLFIFSMPSASELCVFARPARTQSPTLLLEPDTVTLQGLERALSPGLSDAEEAWGSRPRASLRDSRREI